MTDPTVDNRLHRFRLLTAQATTEPFPQRRQAKRLMLVKAAHELIGERERIERLMLDGDAWLTAHPDVTDFAEREDRWLAWLDQYRAIEDALADGKGAL
jgi:hypothetical protein